MFFRRNENSLKSRRQRKMEEMDELCNLRDKAPLEKWDFLAMLIAGFISLLPIVAGILLCYYLITRLIFF